MSLEIGGGGSEYTTLQDYYDEIKIEDGDMILGNVYLEIPPSHIAVNEAYQISSTPGAIRQRSSIKMNKGKTARAISMSLYFVDPVDAGIVSNGMSNLYEIINLFKYSPFVAVKNKYLNDTWGIDALALASMSIQSDREFPGAYFIQLQVEQFNYKSYVPYAPSFASIIDYGKYVQYLRRGINKTNVEMNGGSFAIGEDHIHSDTDIDFLIHDTIPDRLGTFHSWDDIQDDIVYPRTTLERLKEKYPDLVDTWTFGFGWDSSTTTSHWDSGEVADVIEEISNALGSVEFDRIKEQIRNMYGAELSEAELNFQTVRFVLQQLTLAIQNAEKGTKENPRDLYDLEHESYEETWIEEWAVPMVGMKLSDAVSIHSISASIVNYFARLPILSHEAVAHQYVGGGNMELAINMEIVGEDDVKKLRKLMKRSQDVARLTKAIGTLGFLGVRSDVSRLMGCKYWMPLNLSIDTNPQVPHLYNCSFQLTDFDIYQQEKESWCRQQLSQGMLGNPFMRIKQFGKYFQLYPDLPLEFKEESGWEAPDFYFITTPIVSQAMETRPIGGTTTKVASVNGNPFKFNHRFDPVNGITIDFDASDGSGGGSVKFDPPHDKTVSREGWQALFGAGSSQTTTGASSSSGMTEEQYQESIRASVMSPYGDATKSPSDVDMRECLMDSLSELQRRDKWGTMAPAFPSYALFLIDEPRNMLMFRTFGDFYGRRAVVDLKVHTNQVPMFDTASITVSDVYHKSTVAMDEYEDRDLGQLISTFDQFWDDILNTFGMGDEKIQHMRIEPGMRIQLRMGYGNNVADYPILFNGTITEVAPQGSMLTIIAGGDGRELLGIINPEKNDKTTSNLSYGGLFGLMYSEPRDLLIKLLTLRASIARDALALALKGVVHPGSKGGISHFGMLLNREKPEEDRSTVESAGDYLRDANIDIAVDMIFGNLGLNTDAFSLGAGNDSSILSGLGSVVFGALGDEGTQALAGMMYSEGEDWSILQKGLNKAKFKEVFKQAIKNIFDGWDTEIFKRNIYPGNGVGALDYNDDPGGNDPVSRLLFTLADTFDFMSFADEPSFKIMTSQRTIWDIMLNACDVCPNYILAVRPFEHRSTLFFGKQYWKYTSGVEPINEYKRSNFKRTKEISEAIYEKLMEQYSNASGAIYQQELSKISTSAFKVSEYALNSVYPVTNVNGGFIEDLVKGYGLEGCGQLISDCAVAYGVPWELALAMWWMEDQWLTDGQSVKWNNPGNIKWDVFKQFQGPFTASQSTTTSAGDYFAQYPSVSEGIKSWFYYMSKRYPEQLANGDIEGLIYIYAPPSENDSGYYYKTVKYLMDKYKNLAIEANAYEIESKDGWMGGQKPTATPTPESGTSGTSDSDVVVFADSAMQERYDKFIDILKKEEDTVINSTLKNLFEDCGYIASHWGLEPLTLGKGVVVKENIADTSWDKYKELFINNRFNPYSVRENIIKQEKEWIVNTLRLGFEKWIKNPENYEVVDVKIKKVIQDNGFTENVVTWGSVVNAFTPWILIAGKNMDSKVKLTDMSTGWAIDSSSRWTAVSNVANGAQEVIESGKFIGWNSSDILKAAGINASIMSAMNTSEFDSSVSANISRELADTSIGKILSFISGIGNILSSVIGIALNIVPFGFQIGSLTKQMMELQKLQDKKLLDSNYYIEGEADNPFTREFQEEVREIREPFSRVHYSTSFTDMINWNVAVNSNDVYPVVTAVSDGKRPVTVYADKSIDSQFQREKIVETNLDFDLLDIPILTDVVDWALDETLMRIPILNRFQTPRTERDKLYAKRIGLAHVARSLKTMYQGNVSMIGNPYMRPWDLVYLADAYDDYWGLVEIHSCTHIMNSTMGFTTSIEINPIVTVDDPAQWGFMESARRVLMSILHPTLIAGATTNTNDAVTAVQQLNSIKVGSTHDAGIGGTAIYANILAGGAFDYEQLKRYGKGEVALDYLNQWLQGLLGVFDLNPLQNALEWIDGQQDVYVGLLIHNGYPYHAGLKGANGIVVGEAQSTGFDLIDLFMSNKTDVSWTDVLNEIGMNSSDAYDIARNKQYILGDIFSYMLTEHGGTMWTAPATGWTVMNATVLRIIDADTIDVRYQDGSTGTVRFAGINAYEKGTPRGDAASGYTYSRIPPGTTIQLKMYGYKDGDEQTDLTHDLYGRRMAWVYVNGANLCIELYTQGLAIIGNSGFVDGQGVVH